VDVSIAPASGSVVVRYRRSSERSVRTRIQAACSDARGQGARGLAHSKTWRKPNRASIAPLGIPPAVLPRRKGQTKHETKDTFMKRRIMKRTILLTIGFVSAATAFGTLTGCVTRVEEPHHARAHAHAPPPPVYVQDDYVYYPGYEVYYSNRRGQYTYRDGRSWVSRPAPPRVSVDVLFASPSVRLDFHDSPSRHHDQVVRQYPKHWTPSGAPPNRGPGNRDDGHRDVRDDRK
jgi:hypothetical protein